MLYSFGQPADGIVQMAYIVEDIETEAKKWVEDMKVGPWFVLESFRGDDAVYRGGPSLAEVRVAMASAGHMNIEFIQPKDDHPSVYREIRDTAGFGFHHIGVASTDFEKEMQAMEAKGYELAFKARVPSGDWVAYYDTKGELPFFIELMQSGAGLDQLFGMVYRAAINWDGKDPIRPMAF